METIRNKYKKHEQFIRENYPTRGAEYCINFLGDGYTHKGLYFFASQNGIRRLEAKKLLREPRCDMEIFKNPATPHMAYYLGLLWGDGTVSGDAVTIGVEVSDGINFYETFKDIAKFRTHIAPPRAKNLKSIMTIRICEKPLSDYLTLMDYRNKSRVSPTKILNTIPDHLKRFFWLGFLDADGCIYVNGRTVEVSFAGHGSQEWMDLEDFIAHLRCKFQVKKHESSKGSTSYRKINSHRDVNHFLSYLYSTYETDNIGLERKYNKFLKAKEVLPVHQPCEIDFFGVSLSSTKKQIKYKVIFKANYDHLRKDGFETAEDAAVFFDKLSFSIYGHRANTNFPITNYIEIGNPNYIIPIYPELSELTWVRSKQPFTPTDVSLAEFTKSGFKGRPK